MSDEVRPIVENDVALHVFVKKDDAEGSDHYYLGSANGTRSRRDDHAGCLRPSPACSHDGAEVQRSNQAGSLRLFSLCATGLSAQAVGHHELRHDLLGTFHAVARKASSRRRRSFAAPASTPWPSSVRSHEIGSFPPTKSTPSTWAPRGMSRSAVPQTTTTGRTESALPAARCPPRCRLRRLCITASARSFAFRADFTMESRSATFVWLRHFESIATSPPDRVTTKWSISPDSSVTLSTQPDEPPSLGALQFATRNLLAPRSAQVEDRRTVICEEGSPKRAMRKAAATTTCRAPSTYHFHTGRSPTPRIR